MLGLLVLFLQYLYILTRSQALQAPLAKIIVWSIGSSMLLYLGIVNLKGAIRPTPILEAKKRNSGSAFILGALLAIANPLSMAFWFGIFGAVIGENIDAEGYSFSGLFSHMGILLGVLIWFSFLCTVLNIGKRLFINKLDKYTTLFFQLISGFAGLILLFFGVSFASKAIFGAINYLT